ncbi:hypothetical protein Rvan_0718 [Rhodomicrobium vannielii ATCC 17100]|uniref:ATPase AAA-type core domain-containing protein n=1 Tax=Rhodomicrobium vannielii (strain ATCC 17100 / DSM 162 / LMG 4299 / NCIMB 10020 / ATH 3.1.1) TaxID=648757 RepID=E3I0I4_RHOVT|nr:ATP-binding protein [Rhodomicrobium vannielii]ADP69994.1 hypothetical protein Rvan_0718 [Rhodomicrobium vannielii ATCC 17100]
MIRSVTFSNFKRFKHFTISLQERNIIVGPNNSGKSSILDALRILESCMRYAKSRKPTYISMDDQSGYGYQIPDSSLWIPVENTTNNYTDDDAIITFKHQNGTSVKIFIHPKRSTKCIIVKDINKQYNTKFFSSSFPANIFVVPTLGPVEEREILVSDETVNANAKTRLSSRNFRNIWLRKTETDYSLINEMLSETWDGVSIQRPSRYSSDGKTYLDMFYTENRIARELSWSGFGFQIWLQLLTHIMRCDENSTLIIDEPDIYLHSEIQKSLMRFIRSRGCQYIVATHSVEIINDAEPQEIVSINSHLKSAKRISTDEGLQSLFNYLGSVENVDISRLSKAKRIVFFEGKDKKILRKFAQKLNAANFTEMPEALIFGVGGFGGWKRVVEVAWTFKNVLKLDVNIFVLFDRDYRHSEEIAQFISTIKNEGIACAVLKRKEIENYALNVRVLIRTIRKKISARDQVATPSALTQT